MAHPIASPRRWPLAVLLAALAAAAGIEAAGLRLNLTPSLPRGLYRPAAGEPQVGDLVAACLPPEVAALGRERGYLPPGGDCPGGAAPVLKRVVATPGHRVEVTAHGLRVNGDLAPGTRPRARDRHGRPLAAWRGGGDGYWLISTQEPRSWDSRYWGPVGRASILTVMRPVFVLTEENAP